MFQKILFTRVAILVFAAGSLGFGGLQCVAAPAVTVQITNYHGWKEACRIRSKTAEIVVVPAIGRVMQFGALGEPGVFWENRELDGTQFSTSIDVWRTNEWINLGGDKSWPAPEGEWGHQTGRTGWRPPPGFDGRPCKIKLETDGVELISEVDPFYGVQVSRRIHLDAKDLKMTIRTRLRKVTGPSIQASVWVITQFQEPLRLYLPIATPVSFPSGYRALSKDLPPDLRAERGVLSLSRDSKSAYKIGSASSVLLWVGEKWMCRIESPRTEQGSYPDGGCSGEIYTNPDPRRYVELETLGPLSPLNPGAQIERTNRYLLIPRRHADPDRDAREIL